MGNSARKTSYPKSASSAGNASKKIRWGVGLGVPSPPGKPILVPGEEDSEPDTVGIRWERSPSNGGSAIIGYIVEHRKLGSPNWVRSAPFLCTFPELTLSGLDPGWRYQFRVRAQNAVGLSDPSELSDPLTVTLQRTAASAPRFDLELKNIVALENDQVEFAVSFTGAPLPKIAWFKDGFEIFSSRRTRIITENGRSNLLIYRIALDDEGEIKCTATNKAGHVSTKARLTLEAPPRIRLPRQYEDGLLFDQDETIRLKVSLAGRPSPSVTWYHDGELIPSSSRYIFDNVDGESSLKISDAKRQDRGEYTVRAMNKLGEDISSFLVTVTDRPAAPGKAKVIMTLGRSVTLSWNEPIDDGGCKIGTYIIEYYRVGWNMWLKATTCRQTTTTLSELIEGSEYRFRVKAENPYGVSDPSEESDTVFIPDPKRGITAPNMRGKSQSQREINRGRSEKREVSFVEPSQRTRSLTREEARIADRPGERTTSSQRLSAPPTKPPRTDSRVTFALDTVYGDEKITDLSVLKISKPTEKAETTPTSSKNDITITLTNTVNEKINLNDNLYSKEETKPGVFSTVKTQDSAMSMASSYMVNPILKKENSLNLSDNRQSAFLAERSKSADDADSVLPDEEDMLHGSSEFMLVLYPDESDNRNKITQSQSTTDKDIEIKDMSQLTKVNTVLTDEEEDLVPPPMSFSLPELFSANHQVVEIVREAVSSTELLHERAMERFYKAVAVEEAVNEAKRKGTKESVKTEDKVGIFDVRPRPLRRRLSNSGAQAVSWQVKRERRRSSDSQSDSNRTSLRLPSSGVLEDAASDPNLFLNKIVESTEKQDFDASEKLYRWRDSGINLLTETKNVEQTNLKNNKENVQRYSEILAEDSIPSSEEDVSDEDLKQLKARILAIPVSQEEDTYHPKGRPISPPELDMPSAISSYRFPLLDLSTVTPDRGIAQSTSPPPVVPKSILKKRVEIEPVPVNQFGRPIPPEVPLERPIPQRIEPPVVMRQKSPEVMKAEEYNLISELEKDSQTVLHAAEAAKDRRKQLKQSSKSSFEGESEEQAEERMAVVSHYTEIVKEYAMAHVPFPPRPTSRQSSREKEMTQENPPRPPSRGSMPRPITEPPIDDFTFQHRNVPPILPVKIIQPIIVKPEEITQQIKNVVSKGGNNVRSITPSRNESPAPRSRNVSRERGEPSSRSTSKTRSSSRTRSKRSSSRTRSSSKTRAEKQDVSSRVSVERHAKSSRPTSRASSRDRSRAVTPTEARMERLEKTIENKMIRSRKNSQSTLEKENARVVDANTSRAMQIMADRNVQLTMSYITDVSLLLAAVYIYLFKREIFAIPFIGLLLYRHIEKKFKNLFPNWRRYPPPKT